MSNYNLLADALYYTKADSGVSTEKAQGVVIGVVSAIMAMREWGFFLALDTVKKHLPKDYRPEAIPEAWREYFTE